MTPFKNKTRAFYVAPSAIIIGFVCLRTPPVNGFLTLTATPIFLILGYVILVTAGWWLSKKPFRPEMKYVIGR
ncbi:MAG: hypothetical protein ACOYVF_14875 [Candidatus Zixiibacteriota bacterium]